MAIDNRVTGAVMRAARTTVLKLRLGDVGATMPEYGLMLAFIAAIVLAGAQAVGLNVLGRFNDLAISILNAGS